MTEQTIAVSLLSDVSSGVSTGRVQVQVWDRSERVRRAFRFGGMCFGFAVVSIFIPLLHFVLVPLFLIAIPVVASWVLGQESVIVGGEGTCPSCAKTLVIARRSHQFPFRELCSACQREVKVEAPQLSS